MVAPTGLREYRVEKSTGTQGRCEKGRNMNDMGVQASMSQVEMTVWLCVMAIMAVGMLFLLAIVSA